MPRPVWSGAISFGLVTIPIKVLPATESHNISFHQYHLDDMGRIRYRKICELDGKQLRDDEIGKGFEVSKDTLIEITDEDLANMPLPTAKAIEIVAFVPADSIDPIRISNGYYLSADGQVSAKPYKLLRQALERSSKVAVAKFAWHGRERLGLLRVKDDAIVLHAMRWPDEIRSPRALAPKPVEVDDSEIEGAVALMEAMGQDDISGYTRSLPRGPRGSHRREGRGQAAEPGRGRQAQPAGEVVDLMAALNASVQAAKESRGETARALEHATVHDMPKKRAAKKTALPRRPRRRRPPRRRPRPRRRADASRAAPEDARPRRAPVRAPAPVARCPLPVAGDGRPSGGYTDGASQDAARRRRRLGRPHEGPPHAVRVGIRAHSQRAGRPLPDRRPRRTGRGRRRVPGPGSAPEASGGRQGVPSRGGSGDGGTLRRRSPPAGPPSAPRPDHGLRHRAPRRFRLPGHGAGPGRHPAAAHRLRPASPFLGVQVRSRARGSVDPCARRRNRAPRRQAQQHPARRRGQAAPDRLRHIPDARHPHAHRAARPDRHSGLSRTGAGARQGRRNGGGHLRHGPGAAGVPQGRTRVHGDPVGSRDSPSAPASRPAPFSPRRDGVPADRHDLRGGRGIDRTRTSARRHWRHSASTLPRPRPPHGGSPSARPARAPTGMFFPAAGTAPRPTGPIPPPGPRRRAAAAS